MKIIVAGTFRYTMYQDALLYGINSNGEQGIKLVLPEDRPYNIFLPIQNAIRLYRAVKREKPNAVFLYRVENILPLVVKIIKRRFSNICMIMYHNDDPFRKGFKRRVKSFLYLRYIKYVDIVYVYRKVNLLEAQQRGAKHVKLYMSHYDSRHDLRSLNHDSFHKKTDRVVFIGHCELDDRIEYLDYLFQHGINLHIYGPDNWKEVFDSMGWPSDHRHGKALGEEYRKTIHDASIALAFFSKANRDEYTRRCFEIPVIGTLLLAPRTSVMEELFKDGENVCLFSSKEDLLKIINYYSSHNEERDWVAENGYLHVTKGDFSELSRARMVIKDINEWKNEYINI